MVSPGEGPPWARMVGDSISDATGASSEKKIGSSPWAEGDTSCDANQASDIADTSAVGERPAHTVQQ